VDLGGLGEFGYFLDPREQLFVGGRCAGLDHLVLTPSQLAAGAASRPAYSM
jgi:hypothetical protein